MKYILSDYINLENTIDNPEKRKALIQREGLGYYIGVANAYVERLITEKVKKPLTFLNAPFKKTDLSNKDFVSLVEKNIKEALQDNASEDDKQAYHEYLIKAAYFRDDYKLLAKCIYCYPNIFAILIAQPKFKQMGSLSTFTQKFLQKTQNAPFFPLLSNKFYEKLCNFKADSNEVEILEKLINLSENPADRYNLFFEGTQKFILSPKSDLFFIYYSILQQKLEYEFNLNFRHPTAQQRFIQDMEIFKIKIKMINRLKDYDKSPALADALEDFANKCDDLQGREHFEAAKAGLKLCHKIADDLIEERAIHQDNYQTEIDEATPLIAKNRKFHVVFEKIVELLAAIKLHVFRNNEPFTFFSVPKTDSLEKMDKVIAACNSSVNVGS